MSEANAVLNQEVLRSCLKQIKRTIDCKGKGITIIPEFINEFKHLLFVDISQNAIADVTPFVTLPNVISFEASENSIESLEPVGPETSLEACLTVNLSKNRIQKVTKLNLPVLKRLDLSENQIASIDETFDGHLTLEWIDLSKNQLKSLDGLNGLPQLTELNLSENQIATIGAINDVPELKILDLSNNQLTSLEGIQAIQSLKTLIVRDNQIENQDDFKILQQLPLLRELNVEGNPGVGDEDQFKLEMLLLHPRLTLINGQVITEEDRKNTKDLAEERKREAEEKRRAEEEAGNEGGEDEE